MGFRIAIIKLGALGDVVRTTCLLDTLKRQYPSSHITWVTSESAVDLLKHDPRIDKLLAFNIHSVVALTNQKFDLVLSLDKEAGPAGLCNMINSDDKRGICLTQWGTSAPCNEECQEYFELGLDDDKKFFRNNKSYSELIHDALDLPYIRQPYRLYCDDEILGIAKEKFEYWRMESEAPLIGINTGAGSVFANKTLSPDRWVKVITLLQERGYQPVLLGGADEKEKNAWIQEQSSGRLLNAGWDNTLEEFVAIVSQCDAIITGDTLALHIAIARDIPLVALFGPTCPQEIDLFDRGVKIMSPADCAPCYRRACNRKPSCMDIINIEQIVQSVETLVTISESAAI